MNENFIQSACRNFVKSSCQNRDSGKVFVPKVRGLYFNGGGGCSSQADIDLRLAVARTMILSVPDNTISIYQWPAMTFIGSSIYLTMSQFQGHFDGYNHYFFNSSANYSATVFGGDGLPCALWTNPTVMPEFFFYTQIISPAYFIRRNFVTAQNGFGPPTPALGIGGRNPYKYNVTPYSPDPGSILYSDVNAGVSPGYGPFQMVQSWAKNRAYREIPMPRYQEFGVGSAAGLMNYLSVDSTGNTVASGTGGTGSAGGGVGSGSGAGGGAGGGFDDQL